MKTITFHITALQPLLLTSLQGDPNSSVSFSYIPGSVLRGALIWRYCQTSGKKLDLDNATIRRWFFDGNTRYLHAYPKINDLRSLPMPRTLVLNKDDRLPEDDETERPSQTIYDRSIATPENMALVSLTGFMNRDQQGDLWSTNTSMLVNIHNQRDRPRGRGVEGAGAVFRYEAIAPQQDFVAAIICDHDDDAQQIAALIPERLWLGGSRSAGYGAVQISKIDIINTWNEILSYEAEQDEEKKADYTHAFDERSSQQLTITLTSDMIIRNDHGTYSNEPPHQKLSQLLGVTLTLDESKTALGATLLGGFNRTWGLPLQQIPALTAGSVLTYTCDKIPSSTAIKNLETIGIGERRVEGFGRLLCNMLLPAATHILHVVEQETDEKRGLSDPSANESILSKELDLESKELAHVMARRLLIERLDHHLIELTRLNQIDSAKNLISNTQLSRLRIIARRTLGSGHLDVVQQFLDTLPANAREQFTRARVGYQSLDAWIREHLTPIATDWDGNKQLQIDIAGEQVEPDHTMKNDFNARLLMSISRMKVKETRGGDND